MKDRMCVSARGIDGFRFIQRLPLFFITLRAKVSRIVVELCRLSMEVLYRARNKSHGTVEQIMSTNNILE